MTGYLWLIPAVFFVLVLMYGLTPARPDRHIYRLRHAQDWAGGTDDEPVGQRDFFIARSTPTSSARDVGASGRVTRKVGS